VCYFDHYSFIDADESTLTPPETLLYFLNRISKNIKDILGINFTLAEQRGYFGSFQLLVGGGDANEAQLVKSAFQLLNLQENNLNKTLSENNDAGFLYGQLINNVIIINSVVKDLSNSGQATGKFFY
jgi:hypothetical protein